MVGLSGTVFTIAVPVDVTPTLSADEGEALFLVSAETEPESGESDSSGGPSGEGGQGGSAGAVTGSIAGGAGAKGESGDGGTAPDPGTSTGDDGPLNELPPVPRPRITPPSMMVVPVGGQPPSSLSDSPTAIPSPFDGAAATAPGGSEPVQPQPRETTSRIEIERRPGGTDAPRQPEERAQSATTPPETIAPVPAETTAAGLHDEVFARLGDDLVWEQGEPLPQDEQLLLLAMALAANGGSGLRPEDGPADRRRLSR